MTTRISQSQKAQLQQYLSSGDYPAAYGYLADIVRNAPNGESTTAAWLEKAASINANDGSAVSEFVRAATREAGENNGQVITDLQFQSASDYLAQKVVEDIIEKGSIPSTADIVKRDVSTVVERLGLPPEGWAGTLGGRLPETLWGLELPLDSGFYQDLLDSLEERGIDTWRERLEKFTEVLDNNIAGGLAVLEDFLRDSWNTLNEFIDSVVDEVGDVGNDISDAVNDFFNNAHNWMPRRDPLILDLDGDGVETLPADGNVLFDHNGDGVKQGTGWVAPDDGLLVLDRNGNGLIDNGGELFGDNTRKSDGSLAANGFDALSDLDSNGDGVIDASDTSFADLRIWQDSNSDGISQPDELQSLSEHGIQSIDLAYEEASTATGDGNVINSTGSFNRADNTAGALQSSAASLDFAANNFFREFTDVVEVPGALLNLPELCQRRLRQASGG